MPAKAKGTGPDIVAFAALAAAMLLWSGTFIAMRVALSEMHPLCVMFCRMLTSSILLLPIISRQRRNVPFKRGDGRIIFFMVLADPCLYFLFESYALTYTTASQAGMVTVLLPLMVGAAAFFVLGERQGGVVWIGFLLAVAGVTIMSLTGENTPEAPDALLGNSLEFLAMCMAMIYTLCVRRLAGYPPFIITAMQSLSGVIFFGLLLFLPGVPLPGGLSSPPVVGSLIFLSCVTIVAYGCYNIGVARLSAGQASAWIGAIPAVTLVLGVALLDERLTRPQMLALIPIMAGMLLSQLGKPRPARARG